MADKQTDPSEPLCEGNGPFRPNVAALILRRRAGGVEALLGERVDTPGCWQWPQGGIDPGEPPDAALARELREEIGIQRFKLLYRFPDTLRYHFPQRLYDKFQPNIGQEQHYFIIELDPDDPPDLRKAETEEFSQLRWLPMTTAPETTVWFKREVYRAAIRAAEKVIPNLTLASSD